MTSMLSGPASFNQDISSWNTGSVTTTSGMFRGATAFNQNIGSWDMSNVTDISRMFQKATAFNQNIGSWDTSSVANMSNLFVDASNFDQDLGGWDIGSLTNAASMINSNLSSSNYDALLIGWAAQAPNIQSNVTLSTGPQYTSAAASARNVLTSTYNWTISDAGQAP